jgi:tetratricopeptide (TPR) repeat protein
MKKIILALLMTFIMSTPIYAADLQEGVIKELPNTKKSPNIFQHNPELKNISAEAKNQAKHSSSPEGKHEKIPEKVQDAFDYIQYFKNIFTDKITLVFAIIITLIFLGIAGYIYIYPPQSNEKNRTFWFMSREFFQLETNSQDADDSKPNEKQANENASKIANAEPQSIQTDQKIIDEQLISALMATEVPESNLSDALTLLKQKKFVEAYEKAENAALVENEDEGTRVRVLTWIATDAVYAKQSWGLDKLRILARTSEEESFIHNRFCMALLAIEEFDAAIEEINGILNNTQNESDRTTYLVYKSRILAKNSLLDSSISTLKESLQSTSIVTNRARLFEEIGAFYFDTQGDKSWQGILCWQTALKLNPKKESLLFNLAYRYEEQNKHGLSLYYYKLLLQLNPEYLNALNNAGVAASSLGFPFTSINYYKESRNNGSTLSASNLARAYIEKGFYIEAKEILDEARKQDDFHKNVNYAYVDLDSKRDHEEKELRENQISTKKFISKNENFGELIIKENFDFPSLAGDYIGKPNDLKISINKEGEIVGEMIFPSLTGLASRLAGIGGLGLGGQSGTSSPQKKATLVFDCQGDILWFTWEVFNPNAQRISLMITSDTEHGSGCLEIKDSGKILTGYYLNASDVDAKNFEWTLERKV